MVWKKSGKSLEFCLQKSVRTLGRALGKLTGCEGDLAINLPSCFRLLFLLLKNPTDLLDKNLMRPLKIHHFVHHLLFFVLLHNRCLEQAHVLRRDLLQVHNRIAINSYSIAK